MERHEDWLAGENMDKWRDGERERERRSESEFGWLAGTEGEQNGARNRPRKFHASSARAAV